ncbi:cytochrome c1 [Terricaulis sp.]|uniref:cytochrome c1 n=1 Tax=Terricaulis sp. TaxID=2768686 RepID=UPI0037843561
MLRAIIIATALVAGIGVAAYAASEAEHPHDYNFSFEGPTGSYDMAAVQRGFVVYNQVCSSCHSMKHLAYRHLGERGGPFALYRVRNHETGETENRIGLPRGEHGEFIDVTENPYVRSIAQAVTISDIDQNTGTQTDRPGRISDPFRQPFPNEIAARAANGGALPPDLSEIVLARHGGADYVHSLLTGYTGEQRGAQYVNRYFPGTLISMPPPLHEGAVSYADGTEATVEQQASDVANFLQWAADPHMEARKTLGFQVILFLALLSIMLYLAYKQVWKGESH